MSRAKILEVAESQIGVKEVPNNKTLYGEWYGMNGVAWCAIFVSWVYDKAGHPLGKIDAPKGYHYCPSAYNFWKKSNEVTTNPEPGDIVLYSWKANGFCDHTGIFVGWADAGKKTLWSIEGNTADGNDSDGGKVMKRKRNIGAVQAFVKSKALQTTVEIVPVRENLSLGSMGTEVSRLQQQLCALGYQTPVDGEFTMETQKALKQFQKDVKLEQTGKCTPELGLVIASKLKQ